MTPFLLSLTIGLAFGMAISTQDFQLAFRRVGNYINGLRPSTQLLMKEVKSILAQFSIPNQPDLQVVGYAALTGTDTVIADAACKIYAIVAKKTTTTAAWFKGSDSASASSSTAGEVTFKQAKLDEVVIVFPKGFDCANGFTISSDTTASGNTGSSAGDGAAGFVILGA